MNKQTFAINMLGNKGMMTDSNNNAVISLNGVNLLVDMGITVKTGMEKSEIGFEEIDYIFMTHADPDHSQIVYFLQNTYWRFGPKGHVPHVPKLLVLPEQMEWIDAYTKYTLGTQGMTLNDFVDVVIVEDHKHKINGFEIDFIDTTGLHCKGMQSFGLVVEEKSTGKNLIYTSDIKDLENSEFKKFVKTSSTIFQDCNAKGDPVHSSLEEVLMYYPKENHDQIHLMHLSGDFEPFKELMEEKGVKMTVANEWVVL